jgi:Tfp pilus assembly protein PilP
MIRGMLAIALLFFLSACGGKQHDLRQFVQLAQARSSSQVAPLPHWAQVATFELPQIKNRRSPFGSLKHQSLNQTLNIDSLHCVGSLQEGKRLWGLVEQTNQQVIFVQMNDVIGSMRVVRIRKDAIDLEKKAKGKIDLRSLLCQQ